MPLRRIGAPSSVGHSVSTATPARLLRHCPDTSRRADVDLPTFEEFCRAAGIARDSSPGPNGLPYSAWIASRAALVCLYSATGAMSTGETVPAWFNAATVILIPKKLPPGATAYAAKPGEYRPLTLANTAQKSIAKAVDATLSKIAASTVHEAQTGFVRDRSMLNNVLRLEGAVEYAYDPRDEAGIFLFDVAAAFPSISHAWLWQVLRTMRLRLGVLRVATSLYSGAAVRIAWGGRVSASALPVRSGVNQACPIFGTLWALAYDPIVRSILAAIPRSLVHDDLGLSVRYRFKAMLALKPVLKDMAFAANLPLNAHISQLVDFSADVSDTVRDKLRRFATFADVDMVRSGRYLGVLVVPGAAQHALDAVVGKFLTRVCHVAGMPLHFPQRVRPYCMFAFSVLRFLMQAAVPTRAVLPAEQAAVASLTRSAMHSLRPGLLSALPLVGARVRWPDVAVTGHPTLICAAASPSDVLAAIDLDIAAAGSLDDALLMQRHAQWRSRSGLVALRRAREAIVGLPLEVRAVAVSQNQVARHL